MRLAKFLASCGVASRRKSEEIIYDNRVIVNGDIIRDPAHNVTEKDKVFVDNKKLISARLVYYLINKPIGYTSTVSDSHAEHTVTELVPDIPSVWPAGRLDKNTSGILILTNDGELTQKITHPSHNKYKEYALVVDRPLSNEDISKIKQGIILEDGFFKPDNFETISSGKYLIKVHEGRNRLIRRSIEHFGKNITKLERTKVGGLGLEGLKTGDYRELTQKELRGLLNA